MQPLGTDNRQRRQGFHLHLALCDAGTESLGSLASTSRSVSPARPGILSFVCVTCQSQVCASRCVFGACANPDCEKLWRPQVGTAAPSSTILVCELAPHHRGEARKNKNEKRVSKWRGAAGMTGECGKPRLGHHISFFFRPVYLDPAQVCYPVLIACSEAVSPGKQH